MKSNPRIAFIIDTLPSIGGGEKTLFAALEIFPGAELFTLIYNKDVFADTPIGKYTMSGAKTYGSPVVFGTAGAMSQIKGDKEVYLSESPWKPLP